MQLDSYHKASVDIIDCLKTDLTIFIISSMNFKALLQNAKNKKELNIKDHQYISITDIFPDIFSEIEDSLPFPTQIDLNTNHFATEFIASYGEYWIPVASIDYKITETSFCEEITMVAWQRYLRAIKSKDIRELTVLSIDPNRKVREQAKKRLKTF